MKKLWNKFWYNYWSKKEAKYFYIVITTDSNSRKEKYRTKRGKAWEMSRKYF